MTIIWSLHAERDLTAIGRYLTEIAGYDTVLSFRLDLTRTLERLTTFPDSGHPTKWPTIRVVVISGWRYRAYYRTSLTRMEIVRLLHDSQKRPASWTTAWMG